MAARPGLAALSALVLVSVLGAMAPESADAAENPCCRETEFEGQSFALCTVSADQDLRLFLSDETGEVFGTFNRLETALEGQGSRLIFAMNAGMFHSDRAPVGLYVEDGEERAGIVTREGPGNFGLLPNGVFCIAEGGFSVVESRAFAETPPACRYATQSGPMLVIDGTLHPRFLPDSESLYVRNGVGVSDDGQEAWFVISDQPVTFHLFARYFRDALGANNALYFDGSVSRLYAPELQRADWGLPLGPMVGLVAPAG
ncbi:phosphodiester glycosidase family protein [Rhodobacter sp. NTK016B]|uniref:phosphodiester glycosidase family protein n=1 Tax=Rhodobacter sp. NTK016B TaxID=2759676 RepID=UPI001A8C7F89|nr:phosphodiester glycosidase family protein [Rhodobacter sp. NTK016B]MBN8292004.1 phosphodiester glycosidase family protein [Rhodobacter sp. NTK016B]